MVKQTGWTKGYNLHPAASAQISGDNFEKGVYL